MNITLYPPVIMRGKITTLTSDVPGTTYTVKSGDTTGQLIGDTYYAGIEPLKPFVVIEATDGTDTVDVQIPILNQLSIVAEIVAKFLGLPKEQATVYNQKYDIPKDDKVYVAVGLLASKAFGNNRRNHVEDGVDKLFSIHDLNLSDTIEIHISSRGNRAIYAVPNAIMALKSDYSQKLQETFGMRLSRIPSEAKNISGPEGSAYIYRFNITLNMMYSLSKIEEINYYDKFTHTII